MPLSFPLINIQKEGSFLSLQHLSPYEIPWNQGNIDEYMEGYYQSDSLRFASGGTITFGWQFVRDRYHRRYGSAALMGKLTFSELDATVISNDAAILFGRWELERENDRPGGLFTLLFRNTEQGWRIVHDHTSAASN